MNYEIKETDPMLKAFCSVCQKPVEGFVVSFKKMDVCDQCMQAAYNNLMIKRLRVK